MTILTDGVHIVSTRTLKELHDFAAGVGIKRAWYHGGRHPHYDVPKRMRGLPILGAAIVTTRDIIRMTRGGPGPAGDEEEKIVALRGHGNRCGFCDRPLNRGEPYRYVYPVPRAEYPFDGRKACGDCSPKVLEEQVALGLLIPIGG